MSKASATTVSISSSLVAKTRKIVPSAMPAASAICRVLTSRPHCCSSGSVAARIAARRSSAGRGVARGIGRQS